MSMFEVFPSRIQYKTDALSFSFDRSFRGTLEMKEQPTHQLMEPINNHVLRFVFNNHSIYVIFGELIEIHQLQRGVETKPYFTLNVANSRHAAAILREWYIKR